MLSKHVDKLVRFSTDVREALIFAEAERRIARHDCLTTGHLLLGILCADSHVAEVLRDLGLERQSVYDLIHAAVQHDTQEKCRKGWSIALVHLLGTDIDRSKKELSLGDLVLRLADEPDTIGGQILASLGMTAEKLSGRLDARHLN